MLLMPGSLNGDPGEELEWPGVEPPAASLSWQDWLGGPVPLGFPPPAYAIGAAAPVTMMPARQLAAKRLCIMIAFRSGARPWRTYTLNTLLSGGEFELRTVAPGCEFAGGATSRATGPGRRHSVAASAVTRRSTLRAVGGRRVMAAVVTTLSTRCEFGQLMGDGLTRFRLVRPVRESL
jgi:hypothetical protein